MALYPYNEILLRKGTAGLSLDGAALNGTLRAFLSIDGWTPLGAGAEALPPRIVLRADAEPDAFYYQLRLAAPRPTRPAATAARG